MLDDLFFSRVFDLFDGIDSRIIIVILSIVNQVHSQDKKNQPELEYGYKSKNDMLKQPKGL